MFPDGMEFSYTKDESPNVYGKHDWLAQKMALFGPAMTCPCKDLENSYRVAMYHNGFSSFRTRRVKTHMQTHRCLCLSKFGAKAIFRKFSKEANT
jgi:hypothetical protein